MALRPSCFRKFLKNTGRFQPCPLDVLKSFLKTQGGFRAARWMLFVAGRFRLSADSRFRFRLFASTTLNHKTQNRFPFNWRHKPFCVFGCFVVRIFSCLRTKNGFFLSLRCLGIFRVVTFQSKTGRFVARNFSRTRGKFDLRREATQGACPAPPSPRAKKKLQPPLPPVKTRGVSPKRWSFRGTSVVSFMKTRGSFSPARLKLI